jgi:ATP phosphoribosyltransferase regulatory subunit
VRDYLPRAAARRRRIVEALLAAFERWGYQRIITPAYELEEVLARGLGRGSAGAAIRFVDPGSGEVAALRPDFTPQVARLVATRLSDVGGPIRLSYEGSVLRAQNGQRREVIQAGVELIDAPSPAGDAEVLGLAAEALSAVGLGDATLDVSEVCLAKEALAALPEAARDEARTLIAKKDRRGVERLVGALAVPARTKKLLFALPTLYGDEAVIREARRLAETPAARRGLDTLTRTLAAVRAAGLRVVVDLGEVRGFDYYTGVRFAGYASGAGEAVLVGGRYDDLCGRYGREARATGFAVDVEAVAGALKARGIAPPVGRPVALVTGDPDRARMVAQILRGVGRAAACELDGRRDAAELRQYAEQAGMAPILVVGSSVKVLPQRHRDAAIDAWLPSYLDAQLKAEHSGRLVGLGPTRGRSTPKGSEAA